MKAAKPALLLGLALLLLLAFAGGGATGAFGLFPRPAIETPAAPDARLPAAAAGVRAGTAPATPTLEGDPTAPARELARLREEREVLARKVEEQAEELRRLREAGGAARPGPTFTFGAAGTLEGVQGADWPALASASRGVLEGLKRILAAVDAGEQVPREAAIQVQENVEKMRVYEYRTLDKLPTAAQHNGELTHPISVSNLFAALLADAGCALTGPQIAAIEKLGLRFESDLEGILDGPGPRVRRLVAEYRLKQRFMDDLYGVLDATQRAVVIDPDTHHIAGLDLYDPTLILIHTAPVLAATSEDAIVANLADLLAKKWKLDDARRPRLEPLLDAWRMRIRPLLAPTPKSRLKHYSADVAGKAGDATVELVDRALADLDLPPEIREALENDPSIYVPRLLAP